MRQLASDSTERTQYPFIERQCTASRGNSYLGQAILLM